jgi:hypothetical protein
VELSEEFFADSSFISDIPFLNSTIDCPKERITLGNRLPNSKKIIKAITSK